MSFDGKNPFKIPRPLWAPGGFEQETLSGDRVLTHLDAQHIGLDPGGAHRDVALPKPRKGAWFWIFNRADAAENLVIQQADASTTLATANQGESALVFCDADAADDSASGWTLMAIIPATIS